jgi:hypothetical protein
VAWPAGQLLIYTSVLYISNVALVVALQKQWSSRGDKECQRINISVGLDVSQTCDTHPKNIVEIH